MPGDWLASNTTIILRVGCMADHVCTCTHKCAYTRISVYIHMQIHAHIHMHIHTHININICLLSPCAMLNVQRNLILGS